MGRGKHLLARSGEDYKAGYRAGQLAMRERAAQVPLGSAWEATDMKPPKARWQRAVAKEIVEAIRALEPEEPK